MKLLCNYPFTHFEVNNPNGDVTMCCNHHKVLGNVNEQSIEEIWNGKEYQKIRQKFLEGKIFDICSRQCPVLQGWKDYEKMDWYKDLPKDSDVYKNAVLNEKEILDKKIILKSKPRWIRFATSYRCNLKCYHCFQGEDRKQIDVLPDKFFNELKEKYLNTLQIIFFYGGEPLIEKQNIELMEYISEKDYLLKIFIVTNGTVLNDKIKSIFEKLNFGLIAVSIDSINSELYNELRTPADWQKVNKNLKYFSELIKKKNGEFHLGGTLNKKNYKEISDYIDFSLKLNAIPIFQLAGNSFGTKEFRKKYEIYYAVEFQLLKNELEKVYTKIKDNSEISKYTLRNIKSLIEYCETKIKDKKIIYRIIKFVKRKGKIYLNKIGRLKD